MQYFKAFFYAYIVLLLCITYSSSNFESTIYALIHGLISILILQTSVFSALTQKLGFARIFISVHWLYYSLAVTTYFGNHLTFELYDVKNSSRFVANVLFGLLLILACHLHKIIGGGLNDSVLRLDVKIYLLASMMILIPNSIILIMNGVGSAYDSNATLNINNASPMHLLLLMLQVYMLSAFSFLAGLYSGEKKYYSRLLILSFLVLFSLFVVVYLSSRLLIFFIVTLYLIGRSYRLGRNFWQPFIIITPLILLLTAGFAMKILGRDYELGMQFVIDELSYRVTLVDYGLAIDRGYDVINVIQIISDSISNVLPRIFFSDKAMSLSSIANLHLNANMPDLDYPDSIFSFAVMMVGEAAAYLFVLLFLIFCLLVDRFFGRVKRFEFLSIAVIIFSLKIEIGPFESMIFFRDFFFVSFIFCIPYFFRKTFLNKF